MAEENKQNQQPEEKKEEIKEPQKEEKNVAIAIVAYILFFIPLLTEARNDPFVRYHVKQGLGLFIFAFILCIVGWIPVAGPIIFLLGSIVFFIIWLVGILNTASSKKVPLPLIGKFAERFKF